MDFTGLYRPLMDAGMGLAGLMPPCLYMLAMASGCTLPTPDPLSGPLVVPPCAGLSPHEAGRPRALGGAGGPIVCGVGLPSLPSNARVPGPLEAVREAIHAGPVMLILASPVWVEKRQRDSRVGYEVR